MKKISLLIISMLMSIVAWAAVGDTFEVGYLKYEILSEPSGSTRGTVSVKGLSTSALSRSSLSLVIDYPVTYNGTVYQTKEIGRSAFLNNKSITSVTIKWGIERIGQTAFGNCSSMQTIHIPSSVSVIDYRAIWYCKNLANVYLATYDLTNLGYGQEVFSENTQNLYVSTGAQTLIIKNSGLGKLFLNVVETPEANDFYFADGSQILVTGRSGNERACTIIGYKVGSTGGKFSPAGTFSLPAHDVNFKVTKIAHSAIKQNNDIVEADLSKLTSLSEVGASAFQDCKNLTKATIPSGEIMGQVFSGCSALSSVTLGASVTLLGANLFDQCTSLTSVTLPASVTTINSSAFRGASSLRSIIVNEACQKYASYDGALYNKDFSYIMVCPEGKTSISLHPNTQTMSEEPQSFVNSKLTSISFPYGMRSIRELGCPLLTSVYIPSSVTDLKFLALYGCPKLSEVYCNLYNPMKYNVFFNDMASSINLYVPADQVQNYNDAGWNASNVKVLSTKQTYDYAFHLSYGDIYYTVTSTEACNVASSDFDGRTMVVGYDVKSASCALPNFVAINSKKYATTMIASNSFRSSIDFSVTGAACVDTIASGAFSLARGLTSINLVNVSYISREAFLNCSKLATCKWGNRLHFIGNNAFNGTGLTEVTIPESCTTIGKDAFSNNGALTNLILLGDKMKTFKAAFVGNNADVTKITVKSDLLYDYYQAMAGWNVSPNKTAQQRLAPYIIPEYDTQMFSACTQLNPPTGVKLNYVTALDVATGVATTATRGYVFAGYGYLLTGLTPGEMYKFTPNNTSNARMPNNLLRDVATTLYMNTVDNAYVWNAVDKVFEKPAAGTTLTSSSAYLLANDYTVAKYYADLFPAPAPDYKTGDVNGDDVVDITDVNILINIMLGNDNAENYNGRADVTGEGIVDVSDLNALINIVLGN